jgi:RND family efflux transporter MFP subunit
MIRRILTVAIVLVVAGLGARLVIQRRQALKEMAPPASVPIPVRVVAVRDGTVSEALRTVALVQAESLTTVSAQVAGALLEVRVREGDRVTRGQTLARIDGRTLDDALTAAQARLAAATEDLTRLDAVHKRDAVLLAGQALSQQAFEAGRAQLEGARAAAVAAQRAAESASTARGYAEVRAPQAGLVTARLVEAGDLATPGRPLFTIQSAGGVRLLSRLSQGALASVVPGAQAIFEAGSAKLVGQVTRVFPALDAARLGSVETLVPEAPFGLPPGAVVAVTYEGHPLSGLVVPSMALLQGLDETLVIRVQDGRAQPVPVSVKARAAQDAVVEGPLQAGELLVLGLPSELMALTAGTALRPVPVATLEGARR